MLALLVGLSLALLTAYFGESRGGPLHSVQRGVLEALAPVQDGASRVLKPFRDLFGWAGDTLDAKGERDKLKRENQQLRQQALAGEAAVRENAQLKAQLGFDEQYGLTGFGRVTARVTGGNPTLWYRTIQINKGSDAGVRAEQPVVTGDGLVGKVLEVAPDTAQVQLITDSASGVSARVNNSGVTGIVETKVGNPSDLLLDALSPGPPVVIGARVVTSGSTTSRLESLFPPGIPIGQVTRVDDAAKVVHLKAYADLRRLEFVQVLTTRAPRQSAQAP